MRFIFSSRSRVFKNKVTKVVTKTILRLILYMLMIQATFDLGLKYFYGCTYASDETCLIREY
jgi:hypothetical protein